MAAQADHKAGNGKLNDKSVAALKAPTKGNRITWDDGHGFGVRVTSSGARAFILRYRNAKGDDKQITIGNAKDWKIVAARKEASRLRAVIDSGADPLADRQTMRGAPTINDLADRFEAEHLTRRRPITVRDYKAMLRRYIRPELGRKKVVDVRARDVEALHAKIAETAPYMANRVAAVLSKMFSLAIKWEMRPDNPVIGLERVQEHKRERFLSPAEIARLSDALAAHPEKASANAVRLLLLTGARRGEVLGATWPQIDLEGGVWTKPAATTKQKKEHRVPLSAPALLLLTEMKAESDRENHRRVRDKLHPERFLFPGKEGKPQTDLKKFWVAVCRTAGLSTQVAKTDNDGHPVLRADGGPLMVWQPTVRIHDLRHTHASILASLGLSLPIIGALLGHTQAATTARYAHLLDDPLRDATERLGAIVTGAAKPTDAEAVTLRREMAS